MKTAASFAFVLIGALACSHAQSPEAVAEAKPPVAALRARLSDAVGALGNEGFKLRDGVWTGTLEAGKARELPVHLFAGNQYWFCAALSTDGGESHIVLRDPSGADVPTVPYAAPGIAAVGVTAPSTGRYILSINDPSPGAREFTLLYLYK